MFVVLCYCLLQANVGRTSSCADVIFSCRRPRLRARLSHMVKQVRPVFRRAMEQNRVRPSTTTPGLRRTGAFVCEFL